MRRRSATLLALVLLAATPSASLAAAHPRASLTDIENDLMCTSCRESLAVANSPQAISERDYVRGLIAQGLNKAQIERIMVAQYGTAVLGRPPASGFNLTVYVLPPALVAVGLVILAIYLPRWRRRGARDAPPGSLAPAIDSSDAHRLDEELSRFGG